MTTKEKIEALAKREIEMRLKHRLPLAETFEFYREVIARLELSPEIVRKRTGNAPGIEQIGREGLESETVRQTRPANDKTF